MKILGIGVPELIVLLFLAAAIGIPIAVYKRSKKKAQQIESDIAEGKIDPPNLETLPVVANWKTSVGFSVLGVVASYVAWFALVAGLSVGLAVAVGNASSVSYIGFLAGQVTICFVAVLQIVYALVFYKSYFGEKPVLKSSKAISFANFLFGGVIFGALWNANLTKNRAKGWADKGSSYVVAVVLAAIAICGGLFEIGITASQMSRASSVASVSASQTIKAQSSAAEESAGEVYRDEVAGVSFTVPEGWDWYDVSDKVEDPYWRSQGVPDDSAVVTEDDAYIIANIYCFDNVEYSNVSELSDSGFEEMTTSFLRECEQVQVKRKTFRDIEYVVAYASGDSGASPYEAMLFFTVQNGKMFLYDYSDVTNSSAFAKYRDDFEQLVASASYE